MTEWFRDTFGTRKPVIGMVHMPALPGDPDFDLDRGMAWVIQRTRDDLAALQSSGVDGVMFSNEASIPYLTHVEPITVAAMARVVSELLKDIRLPFGVNVLWDARASLDLAMAVGAAFVREVFSGVYGSDFGLWNTNCGEVVRHQHAIGAQGVRLLFSITPDASAYLAPRSIADIARSTVFMTRPDALCVSGLISGVEPNVQTLRQVKEAVPDTAVFANTGVRLSNVTEQLAVADGAVVGTSFKKDGYIWNPIDSERVRQFMDAVRRLPGR